jgi:hypothetical protein
VAEEDAFRLEVDFGLEAILGEVGHRLRHCGFLLRLLHCWEVLNLRLLWLVEALHDCHFRLSSLVANS